jgi:hypothetical protein
VYGAPSKAVSGPRIDRDAVTVTGLVAA